MAPFLIWRWSAGRALSMLLLSGAGGEGGVALVDWAGGALEGDGSVAGEVGGGGEGEGFVEGEVLGVEVELVVGASGGGGCARSGFGADGQLALGDGDVADGEVGDHGGGFFVGGGLRCGAADA